MAGTNEFTRQKKDFKSMSLDEDYIMVVAIDFGTTYSGYSFLFKSAPDDIRSNKEWGNEVGVKSYKTPTCVLTDNSDSFEAFGYEALNSYCADLDADKMYHFYDRFKMALFKEKIIGSKTTIVSREGRSLPAETIITMALEYMSDHIMKALEHAEVGPIHRDQIRWVLTVPAIWSEGAKQLMRRAAFKAGIISDVNSKKLLIALEPEAASYWCRSLPLNQYQGCETNERSMEEGTTYMIVDCGGGTIDLTVHQILPGGGIREVHKANGGDWGGIKVDENFLQLLNDIFGETFIGNYKRNYPQDWLNMLLNFETLKRSFKPSESRNMNISLSYNLGEAVQDELGKSLKKVVTDAQLDGVSFSQGMLVLKPLRIDMVFQPVVTKIADHIGELLKNDNVEPTEYIFLVGGFSECKILSRNIIERFGGERRVLIPQDAGVCVMKGAAMYGYNPAAIRSRISRKSYGACISPAFQEGVHDPKRKSLIDDVERIECIFDYWVKNNQSVDIGDKKSFDFVPRTKDDTEFYLSFHSTEKEVTYTTETGVEKIGSIRLPIPDNHLPRDQRSIKLHVYFGSTEIYIVVEDTVRGTTRDTAIDFLSDEVY